jgi:hypothetical protein
MSKKKTVVYYGNTPRNPQAGRITCPACGSSNLQAISDTHGQGAKCWKLFCFGFLGLCGTGKTTTDHYWVCADCGCKTKI